MPSMIQCNRRREVPLWAAVVRDNSAGVDPTRKTLGKVCSRHRHWGHTRGSTSGSNHPNCPPIHPTSPAGELSRRDKPPFATIVALSGRASAAPAERAPGAAKGAVSTAPDGNGLAPPRCSWSIALVSASSIRSRSTSEPLALAAAAAPASAAAGGVRRCTSRLLRSSATVASSAAMVSACSAATRVPASTSKWASLSSRRSRFVVACACLCSAAAASAARSVFAQALRAASASAASPSRSAAATVADLSASATAAPRAVASARSWSTLAACAARSALAPARRSLSSRRLSSAVAS
mmetsp:Transcript_32717/g.98799  ORF Transcript_32717/g.98799 Transcript_32717/m.98799 type:complete len:296 (+) Transcript_32717:2368-3255(+)